MGKIEKGVARGARTFVGELPKNLIYPVLAAVVGGLAVAYLLGWFTSGHGTQETFFRVVDGNVGERGAGVFESASSRGRSVGQIKPGHGRNFVGFCVGESLPNASNGIPDELWFILPDHDLASGAMLDGDQPAGERPMQCAGEHGGPQSPSLAIGTRQGIIVLRAEVAGASLVGFAVRRASSDWHGLPLATADRDTRDTFSDQAGRLGRQFAAIAVGCWAPGAPAYADGTQEYAEEIRWPKTASRQLHTAATKTVGEGVSKACSPEEQEPRRVSHVRHSAKGKGRKSTGSARATSTTPVVTITTEGPTTSTRSNKSAPGTGGTSRSETEIDRRHTTTTPPEEERNYSPQK